MKPNINLDNMIDGTHALGAGPRVMICLEMKKEQLARRLARESGITPAAAADQLDRILNDILKRVRRGHSASLPGLGTFWPGPRPAFYFEESLPPGARRMKARKRSS
jgi:Bacterial DNA-binding protein